MSISISDAGSNRAEVQVRGAPEPVLVWTGTLKPPYRVTLSWKGQQLGLERPLPVAGGAGPVQRVALEQGSNGTRLEIEVKQNVLPHLRQAGGGWVLQLDALPDVAVVAAPPGREPLLLDVQVNGTLVAEAARADRLSDGRLVLADSVWRKARLRPPSESVELSDSDSPAHPLESAPGLAYRLDRSQLKLEITAAPQAFDGTQLSASNLQRGTPVPPQPGAYVNYDVTTTRGQTGDSAGGFVEAVAFNSWGSVVSGTLLSSDAGRYRQVRTETYARKDWPDTMEALVIGDTISSAGAWSRPVRYGGVRYGRDFALAPGFITMPLPALSGTAALPSTIDVLVNNQRQSTNPVPAGPFSLTNVPVVNGAGELNVVVRDARGVETVLSQSFYASPALLAPGLADFSVEAGALRERFGSASNEYGPAFVSGTYRYGASPELTVGTRAEVQQSRQAAGIEAQSLVANWAIVQGALAASHSEDGGAGFRTLAGLERVTPRGGFSFAWEHFSDGFREFGVGELDLRARDRLRFGGGWRIDDRLSIGASYSRQTAWNGPAFALAGANLTVKLPGSAFLSVYAARQFEPGSWSAGVNLVVPLEDQRTFGAGTTHPTGGSTVSTVQLAQAAPQGPGWGWAVRGSTAPGQKGQGSAVLNTNNAQFTADVNAGRGNNALRVGANGSVGWLDGQLFASRRIDQGAFAVVDVGDLEGVRVSRSNQVVATTDSHGRAVVTGLLPYQSNQLTVDSAELPLDVEVRGVRQDVLPYARAGNKVSFDVHRSRNVLLVLQRADGSPVPAGTRVRLLPGGKEFIVATRGEVYLMDLQPDDMQIDVRGPGTACSLKLPIDSSTPAEARIGPLTCAGAS